MSIKNKITKLLKNINIIKCHHVLSDIDSNILLYINDMDSSLFLIDVNIKNV